MEDTFLPGFIFGLVGLMVGSFLNVVIYRLPIMFAADWGLEFESNPNQVANTAESSHKKFNLAVPASACPHCGNTLKWWHNIPVISFIFLRAISLPIISADNLSELPSNIFLSILEISFISSIISFITCLTAIPISDLDNSLIKTSTSSGFNLFFICFILLVLHL